MRIKATILDRTVFMEERTVDMIRNLPDDVATKVLKKYRANELRDKQIAEQMRQTNLGPRKGPGSQLAGWTGSYNKSGQTELISNDKDRIVYSA